MRNGLGRLVRTSGRGLQCKTEVKNAWWVLCVWWLAEQVFFCIIVVTSLVKFTDDWRRQDSL